jgi:dihydroxyacetone kinase-like protein
MTETLIRKLIGRCAAAIDSHADELTTLDRAVGDGDHGANMRRGFAALVAAEDEIATLDFGPALQKAGMTLVMSVGGASGPLYGSLLMAIGKAGNGVPDDATAVADRLAAGIDAVKKRGKSDVGAKTMLDVLVPVLEAIRLPDDSPIAAARKAADTGLAETRDMKATKGRASFLGERSVGHLDPGARSSALLVHAICDAIEERT